QMANYPGRITSKANVPALAIRGIGGSSDKLALTLADSQGIADDASKYPEMEKITNFYGSSAGSSSCSIPIYWKSRTIEVRRLEQMDKDYDALNDAQNFQAKREAKMTADDLVGEAKRAKRQKKKDSKVKTEEMRKAAEGVNKFASGNFLEMMQKIDPKELEEQVRKAKEEAKAEAAKHVPSITVSQMKSSSNITFRDVDDF
ncbi:unnamed protein product, partial [Polarella glacialis]